MKQYLDLLKEVIEAGRQRGDRTGTGTLGIFDAKLKFDLSKGEFPLLTTKFIPRKAVWLEYLAILRGELHLQTLTENDAKFWDPWRLSEDVTEEVDLLGYERVDWLKANDTIGYELWQCNLRRFNEDEGDGHRWLDERKVPRTRTAVKNKAGDLNAPYGPGWRNFSDDPLRKQGVDQVAYALDLLRNNPESRRILISSWNPLWMPEETREVEMTWSERSEIYKRDFPSSWKETETLFSYPEIGFDEEYLVDHMDKAGVPKTKTVKLSPQDNVVNGKPCLTPCHHLVEFYVEEMTTRERLDWCASAANPYFQDIWEDHMSDVYAEENCGQEKMSPERKAEWLTENKVPTQRLSLKWSQRSVDLFVGAPFNQAFYAYMLLSFAHELGMAPHELVGDLTNVHVYSDHLKLAELQLSRDPLKPVECFIRDENLYHDTVPKKGLFELTFEDFVFTEYKHHPAIPVKPSI